jgi:hypothetical protein
MNCRIKRIIKPSNALCVLELNPAHAGLSADIPVGDNETIVVALKRGVEPEESLYKA